MVSRIKISLVIAPLCLAVVVIVYVYSLWQVDRRRDQEVPVEAVSQMMRDLLRYHEKRGGFPENLKNLEGVVWEKRTRQLSAESRALNHRNYYYFYTRISHHRLTLWAIPTGNLREDAPTWFLVVSPELCRRFKGAALPLNQISRIEPNPSLGKLGVWGLIEQPVINLKSEKKIENGFTRN